MGYFKVAKISNSNVLFKFKSIFCYTKIKKHPEMECFLIKKIITYLDLGT